MAKIKDQIYNIKARFKIKPIIDVEDPSKEKIKLAPKVIPELMIKPKKIIISDPPVIETKAKLNFKFDNPTIDKKYISKILADTSAEASKSSYGKISFATLQAITRKNLTETIVEYDKFAIKIKEIISKTYDVDVRKGLEYTLKRVTNDTILAKNRLLQLAELSKINNLKARINPEKEDHELLEAIRKNVLLFSRTIKPNQLKSVYPNTNNIEDARYLAEQDLMSSHKDAKARIKQLTELILKQATDNAFEVVNRKRFSLAQNSAYQKNLNEQLAVAKANIGQLKSQSYSQAQVQTRAGNIWLNGAYKPLSNDKEDLLTQQSILRETRKKLGYEISTVQKTKDLSVAKKDLTDIIELYEKEGVALSEINKKLNQIKITEKEANSKQYFSAIDAGNKSKEMFGISPDMTIAQLNLKQKTNNNLLSEQRRLLAQNKQINEQQILIATRQNNIINEIKENKKIISKQDLNSISNTAKINAEIKHINNLDELDAKYKNSSIQSLKSQKIELLNILNKSQQQLAILKSITDKEKNLTSEQKEQLAIESHITKESQLQLGLIDKAIRAKEKIPAEDKLSNLTIFDAFNKAFALEKMMNRIAFVATAKLSYTIFEQITNQIQEGIRNCIDLESQLTRISSILQGGNIEAVRNSVLTAITQYGSNMKDALEASYEAASSQYNAKEIQYLNEVAGKTAVAGFVNQKEAMLALMSVLKGFNLETQQAGHVADWFFKVVELGNTTIEQLAPNIGKISATANEVGVSMDEVGASLATMTMNGIKTNVAITSMNQLLMNLVHPTEEAKKIFDKHNLSLDVSTVRVKGLAWAVRQLSGLTKEEIAIIASSNRGFRALATAMVDNETWANNYNAMLNSTGATLTAFNKQTETAAFKLSIMKGQLIAMGVELGNVAVKFMPLLQVGSTTLRGLANGVNIALLSLGLVVVAVSKIIASIGRLRAEMAVADVAAKGFLGTMVAINKSNLILWGVTIAVSAISYAFGKAKENADRARKVMTDNAQMQIDQAAAVITKKKEEYSLLKTVIDLREKEQKGIQLTKKEQHLLNISADELNSTYKIGLNSTLAQYITNLQNTCKELDIARKKQQEFQASISLPDYIEGTKELGNYLKDIAVQKNKISPKEPLSPSYYTPARQVKAEYAVIKNKNRTDSQVALGSDAELFDRLNNLLINDKVSAKVKLNTINIQRKTLEKKTKELQDRITLSFKKGKELDELNKEKKSFDEYFAKMDNFYNQIEPFLQTQTKIKLPEKIMPGTSEDDGEDNTSKGANAYTTFNDTVNDFKINGDKTVRQLFDDRNTYIAETKRKNPKISNEKIGELKSSATVKIKDILNKRFSDNEQYIRFSMSHAETEEDYKKYTNELVQLYDNRIKEVKTFDELSNELTKTKTVEQKNELNSLIEQKETSTKLFQNTLNHKQVVDKLEKEEKNNYLRTKILSSETKSNELDKYRNETTENITKYYESLMSINYNEGTIEEVLAKQYNDNLKKELSNAINKNKENIDINKYYRDLLLSYGKESIIEDKIANQQDDVEKAKMSEVYESIKKVKVSYQEELDKAKADYNDSKNSYNISNVFGIDTAKIGYDKKIEELRVKVKNDPNLVQTQKDDLIKAMSSNDNNEFILKSTRDFGNQMLKYWDFYLNQRLAQIEAEKKASLSNIDQRAKAEYRSSLWVEQEKRKVEKKSADEQRKIKKLQKAQQIAEATSSFALGSIEIWSRALGENLIGGIPIAILLQAMLAGIYGTNIGMITAAKYEFGGMVNGREHKHGGTLIEAEKGEMVIRKDSVKGNQRLLSDLNTGLAKGKTAEQIFRENNINVQKPNTIIPVVNNNIKVNQEGVISAIGELGNAISGIKIIVNNTERRLSDIEASRMADRGSKQRIGL